MCTVSIITICKNPGESIFNTLRSVEIQSYKDIQYIVIDGASTDGTAEVLKEFKNSGLIDILISESDNGIYSAINKGIKLASGDLIGIIHAGDYYTNDAILRAVSIFKEDGRSSVIAGSMLLYYGLEANSNHGVQLLNVPKNFSRIKNKMIFNHPSTFVAKRVYSTVGMYDETYKIAADFEFLRRCFLLKEQFMVSSEIYAIMSYGGISTKLSSVLLIAKENYRVRFGGSRNVLKYCFILTDMFLLFISILKLKLFIFFRSKIAGIFRCS